MMLGMLGACALAAGCAGPMFEGTIFEMQPRKDPEVARIKTNTQQMSMDFRQLSEQLSVINHNQELLQSRMDRIEAGMAAAPKSQDEITALQRDMQLMRADRETLKKEITDDLAARIEKIAARQQAEINSARSAMTSQAQAAPAARSGSASAAASGGRSGYEHKVERGQTLSEIARGYGKSVDSIMKANKITNPSAIRTGQILFIPD